MIDQI